VPLSLLHLIHDFEYPITAIVYSSGKGVYGFLTGCQVRGAGSFDEKSSSFPYWASVFVRKKLDTPKAYTVNRP
jgi:hypothetical protein